MELSAAAKNDDEATLLYTKSSGELMNKPFDYVVDAVTSDAIKHSKISETSACTPNTVMLSKHCIIPHCEDKRNQPLSRAS